MKIFFLTILISFSAYASEEVKLSQLLGAGVGIGNISSTDVSLSAVVPYLSYRKEFEQASRFSFGGYASAIMDSGLSLLGAQGIGTIGWNIFGGLARQQSIVVKGDKVLNLHKKSRAWTGYFDIGYSLTPIFSSSTTATFSGPSAGITIYQLGHVRLEYSLKFTNQATGERKLSTAFLSVGYIFDL